MIRAETSHRFFLIVSLIFVHIFAHIFVHSFALVSNADDIFPRAEPGEGDDYRIIMDGQAAITNFVTLGMNFSGGGAELKPWSDSYWPVYRGVIATRYADPGLPDSKNWMEHYMFYLAHPPERLVAMGHIDRLSPAEKYDLLVGDPNWSLTRKMWAKGSALYEKHRVVPTWTGICHGWAAASQVGIPTPSSSVVVHDVHGRHAITFYPFDIQALVSQLWAAPMADDLFTGNRCRDPHPDNVGGRIVDSACFDVNPMTWHLAVLNRVGILKKSLTMDISFNHEVWNHVIDSYQVSYFNPATMEFSSSMRESIISRAEYPHDPFVSYRGPQATRLVGVIMDVFYPGAISPHTGTPLHQKLDRKRYIYDLELNDENEVVGGEWHINAHPDFIWLYPEKYNPFIRTRENRTENEAELAGINELSAYLALGPLDLNSAEEARRLSSKGFVSSRIVYSILQSSLVSSDLY